MKSSRSTALATLFLWIIALAILTAPGAVCAATWRATVGAQSTDEGIQALAFLPNGLWIHALDSITWTFPAPEDSYGDLPKTRYQPRANPTQSAGCPWRGLSRDAKHDAR
jgi:hypothetical protein